MVEELDIQEPEVQGPPSKRRALYDAVSKKYNLGTYEEFDQKLKDPTKRKSLYDHIGNEFNLGTYQDFESKIYEPSKKKVRIGFEESSLQAGNVLSQSSGVGGEEIPQIEMYTLPNGEMVETDPVSISRKYKEYSEAVKPVSDIEMGMSRGMAQPMPDEEKRKAAKKLAEDFKGLDIEGIYEDTKDLSDGLVQYYKNDILPDREENNQLYQRKLSNIKWRSSFEKKLLDDVDNGNIGPDNYNRIKRSIELLPQLTGQGDYSNQRTAVKSLAEDIREYGGENKDQLLKDFAVEVSKVYGNPDNKASETFKDSPESKYLNTDAQLGYEYLRDISPDRAEQYKRLFIDPKSLKDKPDELRGYNHLMQTLEETGINLKQNAVTEELNSLNKQAKMNGGLTPEQIERATKLEKVNEELSAKRNELDSKYPDRIGDKIGDAVQEVMGQKTSGFDYAGGKVFTAFRNTAQGVWEAASTPFMSDESNTLRELAIMGQSLEDEKIYHKTDRNKSLQYDTMVIQPELQKEVDLIKNNNLLTNDQKEQKLYKLFRENTDKFGRVPIKGGKFNISPSSIMYGMTDLGTSLLPFVAIEAATGGIGGAGAGAKFLRTFTAAAASTFHDEYAAALIEGKSQSEAYRSAMTSTAINSLAMAGAGTPTEIRAMASTKTSAGKLIQSMSDDAIESVLKKGTPKGLKAVAQNVKERIKATPEMFKQGVKTGAKFEAYMSAANAINGREQDFKRSLLAIGEFGILGAALGQAAFKTPTQLQKSAGLEFGKKPDEYIAIAEAMKKDGQLTDAQLEQRTELIKSYGEAYKNIPKNLDEKQQREYLYQTVIKNEATKGKSNLPPKQAAEAEHQAMVADYKREIILDETTDAQLEKNLKSVEKRLEPKTDAEGKVIEIPENEKKQHLAARDAIKEVMEERAAEVADTAAKRLSIKKEELPDLSVPIEGTDKKGVPVGENVPAEVKGEPENITQPIELKVNEEIKIPDTKTEGSLTETKPVESVVDTAAGEKEPPKPPKEPVEEIVNEEDLPQRRFTKQMLRSDELSPESKSEISKTLSYVAQSREMTLKEANDVIDKVGLDEAHSLVISDKKLEPAVRNAVGMTLIKKFNELSEKSIDQAEKDYYLDKSIEIATSVTERATLEGRGIDIFNVWSRLSPEGQLRAANHDMAAQGKEKLRRREKDINKIGKEFQKANEETVDEIAKSGKVKPKTKTQEQKVSDIKKKREEINKKYKSAKGTNLYSGVGLTKEGIEYVGEMAATYIEEGIVKLEIIVDKVIKELKDLTGKTPDDSVRKNVEFLVSEKFAKEGIKKDGKQRGEEEKITKGLGNIEESINKIIKEHYTVPDATKKSLINKFIEDAGLNKSEAEKLAKEVEVEFDRIATRKKRNILYNEKARFDKINKTLGTKDTPKQKTIAEEIIKYSNLGAFEGKEFSEMIANKFGIGEISPEQAAKLLQLANKVQKAPEGTPKNNATEDLLAYRANLRGNDLGETAQAVWYASVLSGYKTHEKNLVSTFFNSIGELTAEMVKDPKSMPYLIAGYVKGISHRGRIEAAHTLKTGYSPIHIKKIETPNVLERKDFIGGAVNPGNWFKYVMRLMVAEDVLSFQGLKEARAYQLARKESAQRGFNTWSKKGWDEVNKVLLHTKERYDEAFETISQEGLVNDKGKPTLEGKRRIYEIMENSRPEKMVNDSYGFAAHGTFNHESEGSLGAITNAVASGLDSVHLGSFKPARLVVPFTRIITNVVNNSLDYTPVGLIRAARGVRGFRSFEKNVITKPAFKELTKDERQRLVAKAAIGITSAVALQAMHQAGIIQITGGGTGDKQKDQQLRDSGWQEYSVKIGDRYYSYKYTPLVFMLGYMGNMNDAQKYGDDDEKTLTKKMEVATSRIAGQVVDMTWINSSATFLGALAEKNPERQGAAVSKSFAGMARGFIPFGGAITQGTQLLNSAFHANKKQADGAWQALVASIPIAQNSLNDKINALGDPIQVNENTWPLMPDFVSKEKNDPAWKLLLDKQGWVAPVNKNTIIVFDQKTQEDRPITSDEYYEFSKKRGAKIKYQLQQLLLSGEMVDWNSGETIKLDKVNPKDFNKWLSKVESKATEETKAELFGEAPQKETKDLDINQ